MQTFLKDLKHALRMFKESPGFTTTAVAALMLGIGANVAIFSVLNAVVLKPIPFDEPDRLIHLMNSRDGVPLATAASPAKFMHWRAQTDVLQDVAAYRENELNYTAGDSPERVLASQVSEAYFRAFHTPFTLGRPFTAEEDRPGAPKVVIVSHEFWTDRLGADPNILNQTLSLSGDAYTIVGVISPEFDMREYGKFELWIPFQLDPNTTDQGHYFNVAGRLKPGVSVK